MIRGILADWLRAPISGSFVLALAALVIWRRYQGDLAGGERALILMMLVLLSRPPREIMKSGKD